MKFEGKVFDQKSRNYIPIPEEMKTFFDEIEQVCKKHGFSISHEDGHGGFIIEKYDEFLMNWLKNAYKNY